MTVALDWEAGILWGLGHLASAPKIPASEASNPQGLKGGLVSSQDLEIRCGPCWMGWS